MSDRSDPYLLRAGETRMDGAVLPFKVLAGDSAGLISVCEFTARMVLWPGIALP